jgi:hypothetical protein
MEIFEILKRLFTSSDAKWILDIDDSSTSNVIIQRFLAQHPSSVNVARILNKFVYKLDLHMYLSAAWSLLFFNNKKLNKAPFIQYIKKDTTQDKYDYILHKVQYEFTLSDNELSYVKHFIIDAINNDKFNWFAYYGINKKHWLDNNMDIDLLKTYGNRSKINKVKGLDMFY